MVLNQYRRAIGTFSYRADVEYAIKELNSAGFPIKQISVLTTDANCEEQVGGDGMSDQVWLKALDNTATCATVTGSLLGAIDGCLIGLGLLAVPGVGPIVAVATSGTALAATLAGAGIGAASGSLISALSASGMTL